MRLFLFLVFCFFNLISCGSDNSHTGVISETSNGATISGIVVNSVQQPIPDLLVNLRPANYTLSDSSLFETYTSETNDSGRYDFYNIPSGRYIIESSDSLNALLVYCVIGKNDTAKDMLNSTLEPMRNFTSRVDVAKARFVEILGLNEKDTISSIGEFTFNDLPASDLLFKFSGVLPDQVIPSKLLNLDTGISVYDLDSIPTLLLDNFNDGDKFSIYYPFRKIGQWYTSSFENIDVIPSDLYNDFTSSLTDNGSWNGKSSSVSFTFTPQAPSDATAYIGIEFGVGATGYPYDARWHDLSDMEEFTFMAKGNGILKIGFITKKIRESYSGASHFQDSVILSDSWIKYSVSANSIKPPEGSMASVDGLKWEDAMNQVAEVTFFSMEDITFAIDDIKIVGVDLNDFLDAEF